MSTPRRIGRGQVGRQEAGFCEGDDAGFRWWSPWLFLRIQAMQHAGEGMVSRTCSRPQPTLQRARCHAEPP